MRATGAHFFLNGIGSGYMATLVEIVGDSIPKDDIHNRKWFGNFVRVFGKDADEFLRVLYKRNLLNDTDWHNNTKLCTQIRKYKGCDSYQKAIDMIVSCRDLSSKHLEITDLTPSLMEIPSCLSILSNQLKSLYLSEMDIQSIPDAIWELGSLESLTVSKCAISNIPRSISKLTKLSHLDVSHTKIHSINNVTNTALRTLKASHCSLKCISAPWLSRFTILQHLNVSHNPELNFRIDEECELPAISLLCISETKVERIPTAWFSSLTYLSWSNCGPVYVLPALEYDRLLYLDISQNWITEIPPLFTPASSAFINITGTFVPQATVDLFKHQHPMVTVVYACRPQTSEIVDKCKCKKYRG